MTTLRLATAQLNPVVGDLSGNAAMIRAARTGAAAGGADLVVAPELSILGYPPEDLVLKPAAVADCRAEVLRLAADTADGGPAVILGAPWVEDGRLYNAALLLDRGEVAAVRHKRELPNYGVFDEKRVFTPGPLPQPALWRGVRLGLPICEDVWLRDVPEALIAHGAEFLICINGSPWRRGIHAERETAFRAWFDAAPRPFVWVNQVGGQDELVFDGASFAWDGTGAEVQRLPGFTAASDLVTWTRDAGGHWRPEGGVHAPRLEGVEADWRASCLAVGDYVEKNGFPGVVLGLSGGIDSALTAAIAVDALGACRVRAVMLPSRYTSAESLEDAAACAAALGIALETIAIEPAVSAFGEMLSLALMGAPAGLTAENLQSRIRGVVLMALSNARGDMVLTTGNKSEMATGYATLYGDMNGGYNALKDLYKTEVFALARWRNRHHPEGLAGPGGVVIPPRIIEKPPSAELRADQKDQDSLPPYEVLDDILRGLVDREERLETVIARGHDLETVERVQRLLTLAEYKRRQAAPGAKIGGRNFGRDRRYPITNRYRDRAE